MKWDAVKVPEEREKRGCVREMVEEDNVEGREMEEGRMEIEFNSNVPPL